ncbi:MAG: GNAT family N-acetyltransferase [Bacteroidetes bacterium]|jgi:GNAT superfamily N-acetyltransferase|nr:GNAT family N-acetyltransferase [Bacteroidota bacterium]MBT5426016.1 GNAT family N-acetyltransferase [Bacteroidota bacterium]MBT7462713.1 GNAT family N-acetyltransferase [Bacteroidota bacterium]
MKYLTVPLSTKHNRESFDSGTDLLNRYFKQQANQDVKRKLSACFVYESKETKEVIAYYTLSSASISQKIIPQKYSKRFPKSYTSIPMILLGRIAIDKHFQGKGVGKMLLIDALKRCYHSSHYVGSFAVVVDPIDEHAVKFYERFGFAELPSSGKMFLPMKTIQDLFK